MAEMIEINEEHINMIMRQTDYTRETAQQKLQEHKNNLMSVIREYMAPPSNASASGPGPAQVPKNSVNQQIYKEIRGLMDDAARNYANKK
jgi:hypothetical protein